ncbi:MAG: hypothetical protein V4713_05000 [Pseudomonadota bacterium]
MSTPHAMRHLQTLLESFSNGSNRSLQASREIEGIIASSLPPDHPLQELAEDFAQYRPGGGEYLYSEAELLPKVAAFLRRFAKGDFAP